MSHHRLPPVAAGRAPPQMSLVALLQILPQVLLQVAAEVPLPSLHWAPL